jgi:hypothetical protein
MPAVIEQRIATLLGNLGLIPFFGLALLTWAWPAEQAGRVDLALVAYAACILSFLGAVHWGLALAHPELDKRGSWNAFGWGVVPSLLGWLAMLMLLLGMAAPLVYAFLIGDFVLVRLLDTALLPLYARGPDRWYPALRTRLTLGVCVCLAIALTAALAR